MISILSFGSHDTCWAWSLGDWQTAYLVNRFQNIPLPVMPKTGVQKRYNKTLLGSGSWLGIWILSTLTVVSGLLLSDKRFVEEMSPEDVTGLEVSYDKEFCPSGTHHLCVQSVSFFKFVHDSHRCGPPATSQGRCDPIINVCKQCDFNDSTWTPDNNCCFCLLKSFRFFVNVLHQTKLIFSIKSQITYSLTDLRDVRQ